MGRRFRGRIGSPSASAGQWVDGPKAIAYGVHGATAAVMLATATFLFI